MAMRGLTAALAAALVVVAFACSSNNASNDGGGGSGGGGGGGATGGGGGSATNASCQDMRQCVMDCGDQACIDNCKSRGNAAAQAAFQALFDCTMDPNRGNCPSPGAISDCVCTAQCYDGACLAEVDACLGGATDLICDIACH
jgi:hypothetical protein